MKRELIQVAVPLEAINRESARESEIEGGCNQPDHHILSLVALGGDGVMPEVSYLRQAFDEVGDLPFDSISVNFKWKPYFERAQVPA